MTAASKVVEVLCADRWNCGKCPDPCNGVARGDLIFKDESHCYVRPFYCPAKHGIVPTHERDIIEGGKP